MEDLYKTNSNNYRKNHMNNTSSHSNSGLSFRDGSILYDKETPINIANKIVEKIRRPLTPSNLSHIKKNYANQDYDINSPFTINLSDINTNNKQEINLFKIFSKQSLNKEEEAELKCFDSDEENTRRMFQKSARVLMDEMNKNLNVIEEEDRIKMKIICFFSCYREGNAVFVSSDDTLFTIPTSIVGNKLKKGIKYEFAFKHINNTHFKREKINGIIKNYLKD